MANHNWANIGSGNGLLPDGTKPLPEPMTYDKIYSVSFIWAISQVLMNLIWNMCSEITLFLDHYINNITNINLLQ